MGTLKVTQVDSFWFWMCNIFKGLYIQVAFLFSDQANKKGEQVGQWWMVIMLYEPLQNDKYVLLIAIEMLG